MHGIVSLLDDRHYRLTEQLWAELEQTLGLQGVYVTPFPHFSYNLAHEYDMTKLERMMRQIAYNANAFRLRTSGLGIFTGTPPVLYLPIVRTQELSHFHQRLWLTSMSISSSMNRYYHPEHWIPHITIAFGDMHKNNLPDAIRLLSERNLNWEITINNLSFIEDTRHGQELRFRWNFGSEA